MILLGFHNEDNKFNNSFSVYQIFVIALFIIDIHIVGLGLGLWSLMQVQQLSRYIVVVSFIGVGNRSTQITQPICHKSL